MTSPSESSPLLFATVLLDPPGRRTARQLGKTEVSSLLRFFFNGEIIVWRNFPEILYPVARIGVYEFDFIPSSPLKKDADLAEIALKANTFVSSRPCLTWKPNSASWRPPPKTTHDQLLGKDQVCAMGGLAHPPHQDALRFPYPAPIHRRQGHPGTGAHSVPISHGLSFPFRSRPDRQGISFSHRSPWQ